MQIFYIFVQKRIKMRLRFTILLIMLKCLIINSGASAIPYFRHLGARDGLAHPSVMSIAQDSLGRLWLGTENGISRYDGNRIVSFRGSVVNKIVCDSSGDVYYLADGQLMHYSQEKERTEILDPGPVHAITVKGGELAKGSKAEWTNILFDKAGNCWYTCPEGLFRCSGSSEAELIATDGDCYALFEDKDGCIWSGSRRNGLIRISPAGVVRRFGTEDGLGSDNVRAVAQDKNGIIWAGTFKGLSRYIREIDRFETISRDDSEGGLSNSSVFPVFVDRDGLLWAGTYYGGVNFCDTRKGALSFYPARESEDGLSHPIVGHLGWGKDSSVWICTEGGGINRLDTRTGHIRHYKNQPFTNAKWIIEDRQGEKVFIATNQEGLFSLEPESGRFTAVIRPDGENSPMSVINVVEQYADRLLLSTDEGVFVHFMESGRDSLLYPKTDGIRYAHIAVGGDKLWIASSRVVVFDLKTLKKTEELPLNGPEWPVRPLRILPDRERGVFATSFGHGLFKLENGQFLPFGDLPELNGYQIASLKDGGLLLSSDDGIFRINREGRLLRTWLRGKNLPLEALVMDSGLIVSDDGTVYAGGTNGLVSFSCSSRPPGEEAPLYFSELYVDGNSVSPLPHPIRLKGRQNRIELYFTSERLVSEFNWADYEYRVKGLDRQWHETEGPAITIRDIPVGTYMFEIRRRGQSAPSCSARIEIEPHWWAGRWAMAAYFIVAVLLICLLLRFLRIRRETARQKEMNETKMRFFTTASHELRTPLTLIIAQLESILQSFRLPPRVTYKVKRATAQAREMNQLVTELIDFRKYEQGLVRLSLAPVGVNSFLSDIYDKFKEVAEDKGISLEIESAPGSPFVLADAYQLKKLIMNLVFNAIKFTPDGGTVSLCAQADGEQVLLIVKDNGIGMDQEQIKHIFDRFYQGPRQEEVTRGIPGSGIGLALAKEIAERHGGSIRVESTPGKGSVFTVALNQEASPLRDGDNPEDGEKDEIVIAEDNPEMSRLLRDLFSVQYRVHSSGDGMEALDYIREHHPVLVVSDVMMPRMDGKALCSSIKGDERLSDIPIVLLTALDDTQSQLDGLQLGADDYIAKPFDSRMLLSKCNNLVRSRRAHGAGKALPKQAVNMEDKAFLEKLSGLIESHIGDVELNNDFLAEKMNLSRSSFYNRFKKLTGETPADHINRLRLQKACELLSGEAEYSIAEIADNLGFSTQNYFCHRFKERFGISPRDYRKGLR